MTITMTNLNDGIIPANFIFGSITPTSANLSGALVISGDVTGIGTDAAVNTVIALGAVTYAKMQNETASTLLGNPTVSAAPPSEVTLGAGLTFSGTSAVVAPGAGLELSGNFVVVDPSFLRSYLAGLGTSNDVTTPNSVIDVAAGVCVDSTNSTFIKLGAFTKSTAGTWVAGIGANGMGVGLTITASTWYHIFVILNVGVADVYFDTSVTAANAPVGTTAFRRIGSIKTDVSSHILAFTQFGDEFLWKTPILDVNAQATSAGSANKTLTVPTGVNVWAKFTLEMIYSSSSVELLIYAPDMGVQTVVSISGYLQVNVNSTDTPSQAEFMYRTNTSAQIGVSGSGAGASYWIATFGWIDRRGRDL